MGEGTNGLAPPPELIEREIEMIRDDMTGIVSELDRRRHETFDWRLQVRRHSRTLGLLAGSIVLLLGTAVTLGVVKARRRRQPMVKIERVGQALARIMSDPEEVARPKPSVANKALASAASAAASIVVKMLLKRIDQPARG